MEVKVNFKSRKGAEEEKRLERLEERPRSIVGKKPKEPVALGRGSRPGSAAEKKNTGRDMQRKGVAQKARKVVEAGRISNDKSMRKEMEELEKAELRESKL